MIRPLFITTLIFFLFTFLSAQFTYAGMINYEKLKRAQSSVNIQPSKQSDGPAVSNRVERLYDFSRDGYLQNDELKDFYKDVIASVKNKGKFQVSSDLLKQFDADNDGQISLSETNSIASQIN